MSEFEQIAIELERLINDSRELLSQGREVELTGLNDQMMVLCTRIGSLPEESKVEAGGILGRLMTDLNGLELDLRRRLVSLTGEIQGVNGFKLAHAAYRKAYGEGEQE